MPRRPKVSIVSITYNHEAYVREALDSFLAQQTDFEFEIVVADDHSTDATPVIIAEYAKKHPRVFRPILREKNIGAQPNSVGSIQAARGDYLALCEGDDYWTDPHKLQKQVDFLDSNPQYALTFHRVEVFTEGETKNSIIFPNPAEHMEFTIPELLAHNFIQTNSVMYRRQDYSHIPENIMPFDWYLHLYHARFGRIGFIDEVMSAYRRHPGGVWWDTDRDLVQIWKKFGLSHLALYEAIMDLYGQDPNNRRIIVQSITAMFENLILADQKLGEDLVHRAIRQFPDSTESYLLDLSSRLRARNALENAEEVASALPSHIGHNGVRGASKELLRALKRSVKSHILK